MSTNIIARIERKIWTALFGADSWVAKSGSFRDKERHSLIMRPNYAYGMLRAADNAKYYEKKAVTIIEFGVASGWGILNMIECADLITAETGVAFNIVGFDTGAGLPAVEGHKDHPEIWNVGDFAMEEREFLTRRIDGRAKIVWGDIDKTIDAFAAGVSEDAPIGFISVDVDIYSGTKSALRCLTREPGKYLPAVSMYFDDVSFFTANRWCGELAAIDEFNHENDLRKIDRDRSLPGTRPHPAKRWYDAMYVCHILDHPARQRPRDRASLTIGEHHRFMQAAKV
jgi:hypothetical protein